MDWSVEANRRNWLNEVLFVCGENWSSYARVERWLYAEAWRW